MTITYGVLSCIMNLYISEYAQAWDCICSNVKSFDKECLKYVAIGKYQLHLSSPGLVGFFV